MSGDNQDGEIEQYHPSVETMAEISQRPLSADTSMGSDTPTITATPPTQDPMNNLVEQAGLFNFLLARKLSQLDLPEDDTIMKSIMVLQADEKKKKVTIADHAMNLSISLRFNWIAVFAEFLAMALFVFIGCGTAMFISAPSGFQYNVNDVANAVSIITSTSTTTTAPPSLPPPPIYNASFGILTALSFGLSITFLVFTFGQIPGAGQINSTVTWSLFLTGKLSLLQLIMNTFSQLAGSVLGAGLLYATLPNPSQTSLGSNAVANGATFGNALIGEIMMTFVLNLVVLMTAVSRTSNIKKIAAFPIGLAVFVAHAVLIPLDGCSINPPRSFGPAILSGNWGNFWVFVVGPYIGSSLAASTYYLFKYADKKNVNQLSDTKKMEKITKQA